MKIYAIFPNPKSGLIEEQLIETENYTQDDFCKIAVYDIFRNGCKITADTLDEYKIKMNAYINDCARNKYMNIIPEKELDKIVDAAEQAPIYCMRRKGMVENGMKNYWTACKETGDFIEYFRTYEDAVKAIEKYEEKDKAEGNYTEDFYNIVDDEHCSIIA